MANIKKGNLNARDVHILKCTKQNAKMLVSSNYTAIAVVWSGIENSREITTATNKS